MLGAATKSAMGHAAAILAAWAGLPALFDEPPPTEAVVTVALAPIAERRNLPDAAAETPPAPLEPPPVPEAAPEPPAQIAAPAPPPPAAKPPPPPPRPPRPARPEPAPEAPPEPASAAPPPPPAPRQEALLPDALEPPKPRPRPPQPDRAEPEPEPPRRDFERALEQIDDLEAELAQRGAEDDAPAPETPADANPIDRLLAQAQTPEAYRLDAPLSMTAIDAIRAQIQRNWAVPAGAENAHEMIVTLRLQLAGDGAVLAVDVVEQARMTTDSFYRTMAESAVRAVRRTGRIEGLSPEDHPLWRDIVLHFNPKDMFGR